MIGKRQLIVSAMLVALTVFGVLNLETVRVSAVESPAIYISPAYVSTGDAWSAVGRNYTFSVRTDYNGSDVYGYEFKLTYNPNVLEGVEVVNGDLITPGDGTIMWSPGTFNNTSGELELTGNGFYYDDLPPPLVSGPGILANVTFTVVNFPVEDYGISNISFVESETRLIGFKEEGGEWENYNIIDEYWPHTGHIEGSVFDNTALADINDDRIVDIVDVVIVAIAFGSQPGDDNWDPRADIAAEYGLIDIVDIVTVAIHFGEEYAPYP